MIELPILYKKNTNGSTQRWNAVMDGNKYWTVYGQVDGKLISTEPTVAIPKNIGKKHQTSAEQQAEKEVNALYVYKKKTENYVEDINMINEIRYLSPMLAEKFEKVQDKLTFPLWTQPKLDGIRNNVAFHIGLSRKGNAFVTIDHILNALNDFMTNNPSITLDGELYCDKLNNDFNKITSLVKKQKPSEEELTECHNTIEYHIYDMWDSDHANMTFTERNKFINDNLKNIPFVKIVDTYQVNDLNEMNLWFERFLENGYEGQILRTDTPYSHKRTKNLIKRKIFVDEEFIILDICEGVGNKSSMAAYAIMQDFRSPQTFKSNIKGSWDFCKDLLKNKDKYIGQEGTVRYFRLTPTSIDNNGNIVGGFPRFPYLVAIRDYE